MSLKSGNDGRALWRRAQNCTEHTVITQACSAPVNGESVDR